jgi:hypothetical protein
MKAAFHYNSSEFSYHESLVLAYKKAILKINIDLCTVIHLVGSY